MKIRLVFMSLGRWDAGANGGTWKIMLTMSMPVMMMLLIASRPQLIDQRWITGGMTGRAESKIVVSTAIAMKL